jgi:hypothetical protein
MLLFGMIFTIFHNIGGSNMQIVKLDPTTFWPTDLVEGYSSMIWTERYLENGEFQLKTANIAATRLLIPEGSLISLFDSREVMIVETHSIEENEEGVPELTTTGRTFETFLENRIMIPDAYGEPWQTILEYIPSDIALYLLWQFLVNPVDYDPTRATHSFGAFVSGVITAVPNVAITDSTDHAGPSQTWSFSQGDVYTTLTNVLTYFDLGVRSVRPLVTPLGRIPPVIYFITDPSNPGVGSRVSDFAGSTTTLNLDIYKGIDRTGDQDDVPPVIFYYDAGDIDSPSYLFSIKDYKNMARIIMQYGVHWYDIWPDGTSGAISSPPTGLDLRILYVDGSDAGTTDYDPVLVQMGVTELKKHNRQILMGGAISLSSPYKYNVDYFLGDTVGLIGQYGITENMQVTEYVRTEDSNGDRGYPTLILATS